MVSNDKKNSKFECAVCYSTHDDEIHAATLRIHHWFRRQVIRNLEDVTFSALELQTEAFCAESTDASAA
jgi:hypothetical protein